MHVSESGQLAIGQQSLVKYYIVRGVFCTPYAKVVVLPCAWRDQTSERLAVERISTDCVIDSRGPE